MAQKPARWSFLKRPGTVSLWSFDYGTFHYLRVRLSDATGHWSIFARAIAETIGG